MAQKDKRPQMPQYHKSSEVLCKKKPQNNLPNHQDMVRSIINGSLGRNMQEEYVMLLAL